MCLDDRGIGDSSKAQDDRETGVGIWAAAHGMVKEDVRAARGRGLTDEEHGGVPL